MNLPIYRHSDFETAIACPWAYGARLLQRVSARHGTVYPQADPAIDARVTEDVLQYVSPAALANMAEHWRDKEPGACQPFPVRNYVTQQGTQFHRFASAYGKYCLDREVRADWDYGRELAKGMAVVDAQYRPSLYDMMEAWLMGWELDLEIALYQHSTPFEAEWDVEFPLGNTERIRYQWHPDCALLEDDGKLLTVVDYKTSHNPTAYSEGKPDPQLTRYAIAFHRAFPTIRKARLEKYWVNPENDAHAAPYVWMLDFQSEFPPDTREYITGPVRAISAAEELHCEPGCWLCPFCEWVLDCPGEQEVSRLLCEEPTEPRGLWDLLEALGAVSTYLNAKKKALRDRIRADVAANGPMVVETDADGKATMVYKARKKLSTRITSMVAFWDSATEQGLAPGNLMQLKSGSTEFIRMNVAGEDVFGDDDVELDGIVFRYRQDWGVHPVNVPDDVVPVGYEDDQSPVPAVAADPGEPDTTPGETKRLVVPGRAAPAVPQPPVHTPPEFDDDLIGAL